MQQKLLEIHDLATMLGFCYDHTRQLVNQAYYNGCKAVVKVGKRMRILDFNEFINFSREMECQEKKNIQGWKSEESSTIFKTTSTDDLSVEQLSKYLKKRLKTA